MKQPMTRTDKGPPLLEDCLSTDVRWSQTDDIVSRWRSEVADTIWTIRLNDFPSEPLYTLFIDGEQIGSFDDWPSLWSKPDEDAIESSPAERTTPVAVQTRKKAK